MKIESRPISSLYSRPTNEDDIVSSFEAIVRREEKKGNKMENDIRKNWIFE